MINMFVKESGGTLDADELKGLHLAEKFCFSCHATPLLTDNLYHNNGIDNDFTDDTELMMKKGRFRITNNPQDLGKFKTPTLRNIEKTAPYMHDGRFATLEKVLDHYSRWCFGFGYFRSCIESEWKIRNFTF